MSDPSDDPRPEQATQPVAVTPDVPPRSPTDVPARSLPDVPADETDEGWGETPEESDDDRLLRELPPHHL